MRLAARSLGLGGKTRTGAMVSSRGEIKGAGARRFPLGPFDSGGKVLGMRHLTRSIAHLISTATGATITEHSSEESIKLALVTGMMKKGVDDGTKLKQLAEKCSALELENETLKEAVARIGEIEAAVKSEPGAIESLLKRMTALEAQTGDSGLRLARRLGIEFAARAGANPVDFPIGLSSGGADAGDRTKTRAEFEAMPHEARNEWVRSGGKVVA